MKLHVHRDIVTRLPIKKIRRLFGEITEEEADPDWQSDINLVFTSDRRLRDLNRKFRGLAKATDVLSFRVDPPSEAGDVFGEIYISVATAARQAGSAGHSISRELLHLICHGLLHLFGYDHETDHEAGIMEKRERYFLEKVRG